ncbi:aspartate-semialdehyde dehydrogenase [Tuanshanicoccus lijuaniae]|uniref:aspartate-semialdehyde dehydrogenase n=1 Tax=Aerococcaceae bacterium zg-1292 TaxID=2774330 RepID=UPI001934D2BE|nr:aspartate-semialdehyde dehydrogenase [Aerococcaceae bacterium zg-1292]QQA37948.1 aspartate-semialdehyde dehydrogenase [Aerococcaceae bacterium zg-1292]
MSQKTYNVAICGASGVVGRKMVQVLEERHFPVNQLYLFASKRSAGKTIPFKGEDIVIQELTDESLVAPIEIAIFSAGGDASLYYAPIAAQNGIFVIDNSSAWRMNPNVPLVVPEVNPTELDAEHKIIANPNCSTIQSVVPLIALKPYGIKRIVYNTYQAVSGAGQAGIHDLVNHETNKFPYSINDNVLPHIDVFLENGYTKEEIKMVNETRKILGDESLKVTATCVRVPIHTSHAVSINVELERDFNLDDIRNAFEAIDGVIVQDKPQNLVYPLQSEAVDKDSVFVGRIRRDESVENGINLWVVADNLRKGAATNSVQIAEQLVKLGIV